MPPFVSLPPNPPSFPSPALLPITEDKVRSSLTGRRGEWPFWISVSREIAAANGPAELP